MGRRLIKFYICALWVSLKIQRLISNKTYTIFPHATARNEIRRSQSPIIQHPAPITHHFNIEQYTASLYTPDIEWIYKPQTKDIQGIVKSTHLFSVIASCFPLNTPRNRRLQNKEHLGYQSH